MWGQSLVAGVRAVQPPCRVLVVEDSPDTRESLRVLLQMWGHPVEVAADGLLGVAKALAWRPEAVIVDIGLPGIDGYEVARRLRAASGPAVQLIALTAYGRPEDRAQALQAGFDVHLVKPVEVDTLRRLLAPSPSR
jgi:CheY-like chemotaxis protein